VPPQRKSEESSTAYVDRLLKYEAQDRVEQLRKMREQMHGSTNSTFDQVRMSSSALDSTLSAFDQLTKSVIPVDIRAPYTDHFHAINEHANRQVRERAEELEMVRLTGKMTAESAKTLRDLAEAATVLLEQLDERDKKADKSTRKQITIAVWSVVLSAFLTLLTLIVSGMAYLQDKTNIASGDKWQSELISTIRSDSLQRDAAEKEVQRLRDQLTVLEANIERIESGQSTTFSIEGAASASPSCDKHCPPQ